MALLLVAAAALSVTPSAESWRRITFSPKRNCRNRAQQPKRPLLACPPTRSQPPSMHIGGRSCPGPHPSHHTARPGPATAAHLPPAAAAPAPTPGPSRGQLLLLRPPPPRRPDARGAARLGRLPAGRRREGHRAPGGSGGEEITKVAGGEKGGTPRRRGGGSRPDRCPATARRASGGEAVATARGHRNLQPVLSALRRVCAVRLAVAAVLRCAGAELRRLTLCFCF